MKHEDRAKYRQVIVPPRLSPRQAQILQKVAQGHSNKEIASALGISEQTVKNHMTEIMIRLGASDRAHAVALGIQWGSILLGREDRPWTLEEMEQALIARVREVMARGREGSHAG